MIPANTLYDDTVMDVIEYVKAPSGGWKLSADMTKCGAKADGLDELKQCIYFMLSTEPDHFIVYNQDYGVALVDLIGQPMDFVMAELQLRITNSLLKDDRIYSVSDFEFKQNGRSLDVSFTVSSDLGDATIETEVTV